MLKPNEHPMDAYLESRLHEWAEWLRIGNSFNIGYPRQSSIAMFAEGKSINQERSNSSKTIDTNEQAEEMEKMIVEMAQYKPTMVDCLRSYYLCQLSLRSSAEKLGISHTQYKLYVQMAKHWLIGKMGCKSIKKI